MPEYRVRFLKDSSYQVVDTETDNELSEYQGSLADCEAWIRLKEAGKLE